MTRIGSWFVRTALAVALLSVVGSSVLAAPQASALPLATPRSAATAGLTAAQKALPYSVTTGPNRTSRVVLSFDDCPKSASSFRATILGAELLGMALVLFPTGQCLQKGLFDPAFARAHGHYVFNHSVGHPQLTRLSYPKILAELGAPGVQTSYGRPPFGALNASVRKAYAARGMRIWTWTVDTEDWRGKSRAKVVSHVVAKSQKRSTVLMHMQWNGFSTPALADMKAGLARRGLDVCRNTGPVAARPVGVRC